MIDNPVQIVDYVEELVEKSLSDATIYSEAATNATNNDVACFFRKQSENRKKFADALLLQRVLHYKGVEAKSSGLKRIFQLSGEAKYLMPGCSENEMIDAYARMAQNTVKVYRQFLSEVKVPLELAQLIKQQLTILNLSLHPKEITGH